MANTCCVVNCKIVPSKDVTLFRLPTSKTLRQKWLAVIKGPQKLGINDYVCSEHFLKSDYETVRGKVRLKAAVVPSIFKSEQKDTPEIHHTFPSTNDLPDNDNNKNITAEQNPNDTVNNFEDLINNKAKVSDSTLKGKNKKLKKKLQKERNKRKSRWKSSENDVKDDKTIKMACQIKDNSECALENRIDSELSKINVNITNDIYNSEKDRNSEINRSSEVIEDRTGSIQDSETNAGVCTEDKVIHSIESKLQSPSRRVINQQEDIEELLTNYHIKQNNIHSISEVVEDSRNDDDIVVVEDDEDTPVVSRDNAVFIEMSVDKDGEDRGDCLMVLEKVQVDVDPNTLMLPDREREDADQMDDSSSVTSVRQDVEPFADPISLLTSSDEDDVILQEPHIDTVEVSDETDEDDVPLVRLLDPSAKTKSILEELKYWDHYTYICLECHFRTKDRSSFHKHREQHPKVLLMCKICSYMTSSKSQLAKHERKHNELMNFVCNRCDFRAHHKISLIYHMKSHKVNRRACENCDFRSKFESEVLSHAAFCGKRKDVVKKYVCPSCPFSTDKRSYLQRHKRRKHSKMQKNGDEL